MRVVVVTVVLCFISLACAALVKGRIIADPSPPVWPERFQVPFTESYTVGYIRHEVNAKYFYDHSRNLTRVDRDNGLYDDFCSGIVNGSKMPCTTYVKNGYRYQTYGLKLEKCCKCCSAEQGCNVLKRNWMEGSQFLGYDVVKGMKVGKWISKKDIIDRVYIYDVSTVAPVISWAGDVYQEYDVKQYQERIDDYSIFDVPQFCLNAPLCPGVCEEVRNL